MTKYSLRNNSYVVNDTVRASAPEKQQSAYAKTKTQISCAVTAQLISTFATQIVNPSSTHIQNFKLLTFVCDYTDRFVSDLAGKLEDRFSVVTAQMITYILHHVMPIS